MKKLLLCFSLLFTVFALEAQQTYWEEYSTGFVNTSTTFRQASYVDANTIWACGGAGDGSGDQYQLWARSLDGGLTWTNGSINLGNTNIAIGSIFGMTATKAYIAGFPNAAGVTGGIWVTEDAGVTWTRQNTASFNTGTDSFTNWVHFFDANNGVCMGDPASGYFEIYTTTNAGVNWTRVPSANMPAPLSGEYGYTFGFEAFENTIWCNTNKGRLLKSTNQGLTWTVSQTPSADFGTGDSYSFRNANEGVLILNADWTQHRTLDGGATWTAETPEGLNRNFDISFVPGCDNVVINTGEDVLDGFRGSSYSTDGGLTWVSINDTDVEAVDGGGVLEFFDGTHGLASGFTATSVSGGVWIWINNACELLANETFSNDKAFTASPNPTSGLVTIAGKGISNVVITDVLGKQVANTNFTSVESATIDMSSFNTGVYLVKVTNANGNASTIKVVRQ
ncbi:MAG: T9SS type A sorting domain-containing protein [Flavobacterium sp.]|uniref:T9SS type A sorting domain-containing protein n=1 Tax=Flavobacterium sp. TaxID=239 RepID=UPI0022CBB2B7|nr:T9SS type A sorting domain-containing protein [Flavobacterium sp.]MCZ8198103.1 T9SS type A sorting domain-containing protein [Flavobacterium sp.]